MIVPWLLFSLVLCCSPGVLPLERLAGPEDDARCSQGLSCRLQEKDMLCLPGSVVPAPGPVLVPTHMQTEVVLRCQEESNCTPCVRVKLQLAIRGNLEDGKEGKIGGGTEMVSGSSTRNASLHAHVVLSFHTYLTTRCALLEVEVPDALIQPSQQVGSLVFDCFEAVVGGEVRIWSYTLPRYQAELNHTQQLPDCIGPDVRDSVQSCWTLPWLNVSAEGDAAQLVLDVSAGQHYSLLLYWNQTQGSQKSRVHQDLTGPQTITLNNTDLVPCLCIQMWPQLQDSIRTSLCPFQEDPRAHRNLWSLSRLQLQLFDMTLSWLVEAPCAVPAEVALCWRLVDSDLCHSLPPHFPRENLSVNSPQEYPMLKAHPNLCVQVWSRGQLQLQECPPEDALGPPRDDVLLLETRDTQETGAFCALEPSGCTLLPSTTHTRVAFLGEQLLKDLQAGQCVQLWDGPVALWVCSLQKYTHVRWALAWLACLLTAACVLLLLLLLKRDRVKGWLQILKEDFRSGGPCQGRSTLLLYSPDDRGFERLVGALASALHRLQLSVAVDLWHRQELSARGPLAWFHAQRRQVLQDGGVVVLLFSHGAVAFCQEWLQAGSPSEVPPGAEPHDAFAASLSCVLPDFLAGRAAGRYVAVCFEELLPPQAVPDLFRTVPIFALPSQLPAFLGALEGPDRACRESLKSHAAQIAQSLQPALRECLRSEIAPAQPGPGTSPLPRKHSYGPTDNESSAL
ncbi:interleukin-17 receptor C isoform X2 [Ornithorhynchus anatinus]|uniref:interleukin-17 receptor C isoform X2 n=1 Tax=Ornithorhynchus anatinus TaxID=9258 RepID=UPI0010A7CF88|nr:interleukin-17 receptor C isoform X2 [Ornithorhynchus anatinus]